MDTQRAMKRKPAGRPSKGKRHGFLVKLSPEKVGHVQLIAHVTDDRPYGEVAEAVTADALRVSRDELVTKLSTFTPFKGERKPLKFQLPMAQAEVIFDLATTTGRTYQDVLEYLLGEGLKQYDIEEMHAYIAEGQGMLDIAV
ncbi:hypothetical protein [Nocardioides lacusdianchii]|uniref:hypothetical protein n=1 Tax=Nocardioides lacusdianchii TaxID=2783664 RepID=UPI001CCA9CF3|nr:hypothetical protein [Nocardioides lacusdianchii]